MQVTRDILDIDFIIQGLLTGKSYSEIAARESYRLSVEATIEVSRSMIAGIHRDLKLGTLKPSSSVRAEERYAKTYIWGIEEDNGGIPLFIGHPQIDGDAVVVSDIHSPLTDFQFAEKPNEVGKYYGTKRLIIAGDLLDNAVMVKFRRKVRTTKFKQGLDVAHKLLAFYATWFDEIFFIPGNHDDFFLENAEGEIDITDLFQLLKGDQLSGKLIASPYDRLTLNSSGELWTIPHQAEASTTSLKIAESLAFKFQTNMIIPHQHNHAVGYDRYNRYVLVDIGGLHDQNKMDYMQLKTSTRPEFDKSFAIVKDGGVDVITPDSRLLSSRHFI